MNANCPFVRSIQAATAMLIGLGFCQHVDGAETYITQTNLVERWITNLIEVRMPANRFVDEYRTNWIDRPVTNVVDVYATNWTTRTLTNILPVTALRTNYVNGYHTNWTAVTRT